MTKEDLIKEAYGKYYTKLSGSIDENGWSNNWNHFASVETRLFAKEDIEQSKGKWRLKSLKGIENNNGWIKIESENDFPKEELDCFFIKDNLMYQGLWDNILKGFYSGLQKINASHYKKIIIPDLPLY